MTASVGKSERARNRKHEQIEPRRTHVIKELVGDLHDEFDTDEPPMQCISANQFTIKGRLSLHDVRELTGLDLEGTRSAPSAAMSQL